MPVLPACSAQVNYHLVPTCGCTVQEHNDQDEPAPPPDTDMLSNDAVPPANQTPIVPSNHMPVQQQASQVQQPPVAPHPGIQSNFFAAALAQAMAALPQQQGKL